MGNNAERQVANRKFRLETLQIHGFDRGEGSARPMSPPIVQSTTFAQPEIGSDQPYTYSRATNPTVTALEEALASIEGASFSTAYATGMAAISTYCLATLRQGDHVVCGDVVYGGSVRLFEQVLKNFGVDCSFVDCANIRRVQQAIRPETRFILVETPANPTLKLLDLAALAEVATTHNIKLVVDNTFLTAALQRPFEHGADVVIYSTTKYIEGHNTTVGGAILTNDQELHDRLLVVRKTLGCIQSPFDAWLTLKGLKTLSLRILKHSENALTIAKWLEAHPAVATVNYPFLPSGSGYELARRQQVAGGGTLSFEVHGGTPAAINVMNSLSVCTLAENLGATETLVTHPVTMTHGDVDPEERRKIGISDGLIRLSVGLEHPDDIIADLENALANVEREICLDTQ